MAKRAVGCLGPICPHVFAIRLFVWVCSVSPLVPNPPFRSWSHPSSVRLDGGCGGESSPISCSLFCVATTVVFSATRALTLLCVIWTEAHTPRQGANDCVALFPWVCEVNLSFAISIWVCHGFKTLVWQFSSKSHAWPLIDTEVSWILVHCVVTYLKDVFAKVATAFDKNCAIAR